GGVAGDATGHRPGGDDVRKPWAGDPERADDLPCPGAALRRKEPGSNRIARIRHMPPREGIDERVLGEEGLEQSTPAGRVVGADPGKGCGLESRDDRAAGRERGAFADPAPDCWKHLCGPLVVPGD